MKCPRCGLINPDVAERCDCGYDFKSRTVERAYFEQKLPTEIKGFFIFLIIWNALGFLASVKSDNSYGVPFVVLWTVSIYPLYIQMTKKKPWARYALMILTVPLGTAILMMREVKLYMLQKN